MIENILRIGNFTSSEIHRLMTNGKAAGTLGKPALTYIDEKNMERRLGRSLGTEVSSRPTSWGNLVELMAFNLLGLEYKIASEETVRHPDIDCWSGSPDVFKFDEGKTVSDIKCPMTLKSFCTMVDLVRMDIEAFKKEKPEYYWQLVSNAILTGSKYAELIVYCPYQDELDAIREMAANYDGNQNKIAWIGFAEDGDLPYLVKGRYYANVNTLRWEVSEEDKQALTERVKECKKMLIKRESVTLKPTSEQKQAAQDKLKMIAELRSKLQHKL